MHILTESHTTAHKYFFTFTAYFHPHFKSSMIMCDITFSSIFQVTATIEIPISQSVAKEIPFWIIILAAVGALLLLLLIILVLYKVRVSICLFFSSIPHYFTRVTMYTQRMSSELRLSLSAVNLLYIINCDNGASSIYDSRIRGSSLPTVAAFAEIQHGAHRNHEVIQNGDCYGGRHDPNKFQ